MIAKSARDAVELADEAWNRGDIEGVLTFYEDDAVFLFKPEQRVLRGKSELRELLEGAFARSPVVERLRQHVVDHGDLALWTWEWCISYADTGDTETGCGFIVLRRGEDGCWRVAIESPWGASVLE